jgi:hypothetical protein
MQPRQLARVRPLGKFYGVTKPIVGPKALWLPLITDPLPTSECHSESKCTDTWLGTEFSGWRQGFARQSS